LPEVDADSLLGEELAFGTTSGAPPQYTLLRPSEGGKTVANGNLFTFENLANHAHGAINHFPIALLFVSVVLDLFARGKRPNLRWTAWLLLALGALGVIAVTVSGLVSHLAYEDQPALLSAIELHQYLAFVSTAVFVGLAAWRWCSLRLGSDIGGTQLYLALALLGLVVLGITGFLGGDLVSKWGIGVKGITR